MSPLPAVETKKARLKAKPERKLNEKASQLKVHPTPGDQDGVVERSISDAGDGDADPQQLRVEPLQ